MRLKCWQRPYTHVQKRSNIVSNSRYGRPTNPVFLLTWGRIDFWCNNVWCLGVNDTFEMLKGPKICATSRYFCFYRKRDVEGKMDLNLLILLQFLVLGAILLVVLVSNSLLISVVKWQVLILGGWYVSYKVLDRPIWHIHPSFNIIVCNVFNFNIIIKLIQYSVILLLVNTLLSQLFTHVHPCSMVHPTVAHPPLVWLVTVFKKHIQHSVHTPQQYDTHTDSDTDILVQLVVVYFIWLGGYSSLVVLTLNFSLISLTLKWAENCLCLHFFCPCN